MMGYMGNPGTEAEGIDNGMRRIGAVVAVCRSELFKQHGARRIVFAHYHISHCQPVIAGSFVSHTVHLVDSHIDVAYGVTVEHKLP